MSNERQIKCPVCRAKQSPQSQCRRCSADLALYLKALRSAEIARQQFALARESGDPVRSAVTARYLQWLVPSAVQRD